MEHEWIKKQNEKKKYGALETIDMRSLLETEQKYTLTMEKSYYKKVKNLYIAMNSFLVFFFFFSIGKKMYEFEEWCENRKQEKIWSRKEKEKVEDEEDSSRQKACSIFIRGSFFLLFFLQCPIIVCSSQTQQNSASLFFMLIIRSLCLDSSGSVGDNFTLFRVGSAILIGFKLLFFIGRTSLEGFLVEQSSNNTTDDRSRPIHLLLKRKRKNGDK